MKRTAFLVDGFNVYHSTKAASRDLGLAVEQGTKWLDLQSLCGSYLHVIGGGAQMTAVYYFSALAKHLEAVKPDVTARHLTYVECLRDSGVIVELSRFKKKKIPCSACGQSIKRYEEKETDVAIAAKLLELFALDQADAAVLVTGDTDLAPAVRAAKRLYPEKHICFAFPYARKNDELGKLVSTCFTITKEAYVRHQFADIVVLQDGRLFRRPPSW